MKLIKVGFLNAIAVSVKTLTLFIINKVLAVYVGPAGYVMIGQLQNAIQMLMAFSGGALNNGVVRYTAELKEDEVKLYSIWRTAIMLAVYGILIVSISIFLFRSSIAIFFFKDQSYADVFTIFSITLFFFVLNSLLLSILNGKKDIKLYIIINILGSTISLIFTSGLSYMWGLRGALMALVSNQSILFFVTLFLIHKKAWFKLKLMVGKIDKSSAIKLGKYVLMALVTSICMPITLILIRNELTNTLGSLFAGYWEAMWRVSSSYLLLITTTLSLYYLPKFSELKTKSEFRNEIISGYSIILPIVFVLSLIIFLFRTKITIILFSDKFLPMTSLYLFQLLGDNIKIMSWLIAYILTAKGLTKTYIVSEIVFSFSLYLLLLILFKLGFKDNAVGLAYIINYFNYLIFVYFSLKRNNII